VALGSAVCPRVDLLALVEEAHAEPGDLVGADDDEELLARNKRPNEIEPLRFSWGPFGN